MSASSSTLSSDLLFEQHINLLKKVGAIEACETSWVPNHQHLTIQYTGLGESHGTRIKRDSWAARDAIYDRALGWIKMRIQDSISPEAYRSMAGLLEMIEKRQLKGISFNSVVVPDSKDATTRMGFNYSGVDFSIVASAVGPSIKRQLCCNLWRHTNQIIANFNEAGIPKMITILNVSSMVFAEEFVYTHQNRHGHFMYHPVTEVSFYHQESKFSESIRGSIHDFDAMNLAKMMLHGVMADSDAEPETKKEPEPETKKESEPETKKESEPETIAETSDPSIIKLSFKIPLRRDPKVYIRAGADLDIAEGIYRLMCKVPETMVPARSDNGMWILTGIDDLPIKSVVPFSSDDAPSKWIETAFLFGEVDKTDASFVCVVNDRRSISSDHSFMMFYKAITDKMIEMR